MVRAQWIIAHWLHTFHETLSKAPSSVFADFLLELHAAFGADDREGARKLLSKEESKAYLLQNPPRYLACFWFLYGRIYERSGDYSQAAIAYQECLEILRGEFPKDMLGQVIVHFFLAQCQLENSNFRAAFRSCTIVIKYALTTKPLPFLLGDRDSFIALNILNRAKAQPHLGSRSGAAADMKPAFELINTWVRSERSATLEVVKAGFGNNTLPDNENYPFLLELIGIPAERLQSQTQDILNWAYLYNSIPWFYGYLMFWGYRENPTAFTLPLQISYRNVIERAANNLENLPSERIHLARMFNLGAEMMLALCQNYYEESPSDFQSKSQEDTEIVDPKSWLQQAEFNIIGAEAYFRATSLHHPLDQIGHAVPFMTRLVRLTWEFYTLILMQPDGWDHKLHLLPSAIEILHKECEDANIRTLVGRCWFLNGRVMAETDRIGTALEYYHKALEIFMEGDGHLLFIQEVLRAIKLLGEEIDSDE